MTDILKHIYNSCDPVKPASDAFYMDCSAGRGSSALTERFLNELQRADDHLCFLFSGHIGCGKSSELAQLRHALLNPESPQERYFPVLLDVSDYLDDYDVAPTDILLAIVTELASTLRTQVKTEIKDNYFVKRLREAKAIALEDVEFKEFEASFAGFKAKIAPLKKDPEARMKVREALMPHTATVLQEVNLIFDKARLALKSLKLAPGEPTYKDIVLILDNLEKIEGAPGNKENLEPQRELFINRAPQLTGLAAHVIYTIPLRLTRHHGSQLKQRYGVEPFVLPMVKVFERGSRKKYAPGLDCLRELLQKRIGTKATLNEVFTPDALDFLLEYSGGHVRNLMSFVQQATTYTDTLPITLSVAQRALAPSIATYSTNIPEPHWAKLAQLELSTNQKIPGDDTDYLAMLEEITVMEYMNGGDASSIFTSAAPWYAVNPIVRELEQFKDAKKSLESLRKMVVV